MDVVKPNKSKRVNQTIEEKPQKKHRTNEQSVNVFPSIIGPLGKIDCLSAIYFHPIKSVDDYYHPSPKITFKPLFAHHFFGLKEEIQGFSQLTIQVFYTCDTLEAYVRINASKSNGDDSSSQIQKSLESENEVDVSRILNHLTTVQFPGDFHKTESSFLDAVNNQAARGENFCLPNAEIIRDLKVTLPDNSQLVVFKCHFDKSACLNDSFSLYHRRVEWFLHYFIDACSSIEQDSNWTVLLIYSQVKHQEKIFYDFAGVVTLYKFFSLPACRLRVSQFMLLPHYQGLGLGIEILLWVYQLGIDDPNIREITVEDPAMSFAQLRDIVGIMLAIKKGVITHSDMFPKQLPEEPNIFIKDSNFEKSLKEKIKESFHQTRRLTEVISLAQCTTQRPEAEHKEEISRDWRYDNKISEDVKTTHDYSSEQVAVWSETLKKIRILVKKRIRLLEMENFSTLTPHDQKETLNKSWLNLSQCYYRTISKIRQMNDISE